MRVERRVDEQCTGDFRPIITSHSYDSVLGDQFDMCYAQIVFDVNTKPAAAISPTTGNIPRLKGQSQRHKSNNYEMPATDKDRHTRIHIAPRSYKRGRQ